MQKTKRSGVLKGLAALAVLTTIGLGVLPAAEDAHAAYNGCPEGYARIAIRLSGPAGVYPSCNLAQCVRAVPEQRVSIWQIRPTPPFSWYVEATYRSHYGAINPAVVACPASVEGAGWVR
jgi:hypothetical protein